MQKIVIAFFSIWFYFLNAQNPYPQDYFRVPLDIPLVLSGTFAELRSNHFHSGLDIKTQGSEGLNVYTAAKGYVSRIKISHFGYGKALYITHPNGYTSVYAHLKKFNPTIEAYVKTLQYQDETYEIEVFPKPEELIIEENEVIAYSGNTGGSGGPHLHFEIRDKQERPINPMLFGIDVKDTRAPMLLDVYAYPIEENSHVNNSLNRTKLRIIPKSNNVFQTENIKAFGKIGFGIVTYDQQDLASNKNGVSNIKGIFNGNTKIEIDFKRFSFSETKHLNRLIDYEYFKTNKSRIQKLFIEPNNPLSLYKMSDSNGYINIQDSTTSVYTVMISDFKGNISKLSIPITGVKNDSIKPPKKYISDYYVYREQPTNLKQDNVSVNFPKHTFYDSFFIDFNVSNDTLKLHQPIIPAQKYFYINFDISHYKDKDKDKLYIASVAPYKNKLYYSKTIKKKNILSTSTKRLGTYTLAYDTENPLIKALNFKDGKWLSKYRYLKLKISDSGSGIKNYRATVNGKWILMEYDYKTGQLVHDFNDHKILDTKNILKLIVTDNVGNSSTFETTFYRK